MGQGVTGALLVEQSFRSLPAILTGNKKPA
jgi:hypothetical protein